MNKINKKRILITLIGILFALLITVFLLLNKKDSEKLDLPNNTNLTNEEIEVCKRVLVANVVGKWSYLGDENFFIILNENKTFITLGWGGNGTDITGKWQFNQEDFSLELDFYNDNTYWSNLSEEALNELKNSYQYNDVEKKVVLSFGYFQDKREFDECKAQYNYLDFFNYNLYKE